MIIVSTEAMRRLEHATVEAGVETWASLMEHAGRGVANYALAYLTATHGRHVVVLVGPGNNGGDGLVAARYLHDAGMVVTLIIWNRAAPQTDQDNQGDQGDQDNQDNQDINWLQCRTRHITEKQVQTTDDLQEVSTLLSHANLIIDALLGMGVNRPVTGILAHLVACIAQARQPTQAGANGTSGTVSSCPSPKVLAVDVPTGIHSDTGKVMGCAVQADMTIATGLTKTGLLHYPGKSYAGILSVATIGIPATYLEMIMSKTLGKHEAYSLLPARPVEAHKGSFGKVLVIAGSLNYPGAAVLATAAAGRVGAGLVTLATARSIINTTGRPPEVTLLPLPESEPGTIGKQAADELTTHLPNYQAVLVGPGLSTEKSVKEFLCDFLSIKLPDTQESLGFRVGTPEKRHEGKKPTASTPVGFIMHKPKTTATDPANEPSDHASESGEAGEADKTDEIAQQHQLPPMVIDADGLNILADVADWAEQLGAERCILTPHPGEMKRLLGVEELHDDRVQVATEAAARWRQVVVLKGATTVIAAPDGSCRVFADGNPALATAGTGDVLAGAIAGLLAQGVSLFDAAVLGVYLHAQAGRLLHKELGDMGTLASDLLIRLPRSIKMLKEAQKEA
jgi:NAD(P)H-hydrate epimerase